MYRCSDLNSIRNVQTEDLHIFPRRIQVIVKSNVFHLINDSSPHLFIQIDKFNCFYIYNYSFSFNNYKKTIPASPY